MSGPDISVIIPIYKTEKFLEKCIRSVRNQTFENIEIICVDDCSPDQSEKIVEKQLKADERIRFIRHEKNLGLGGARNSAIRIAKGEYIASVDSDDYMQPNMLGSLWEATHKKHYDIVSCGFNRVDESGNILSSSKYENRQINDADINIFKTLNPAFWNKLWRTSLFVDNQIFFPNHDYYEDMSTTPRLSFKANSINIIKDRLYNYLVRPESITGSYGDKQIIDYFKGFEKLLDFLIENKIYDKYEEDYKEYVKNNVVYHAKGVLGANLFIEEKKQYLRNLLFLRVGFQENIIPLLSKDLNDLVNLHKQDSPSHYYNKFKRLEEDLNKERTLKEKVVEEKYSLKKALEKKSSALKYEVSKLEKQKQDLMTKNSFLLNQREELNENLKEVKENIKEVKEEKFGLIKKNKELQKEKIRVEYQLSETLTPIQGFAVMLFRLVIGPTMSKKKMAKMKKTPRAFFRDSSSSSVKGFAKFMRIID